MVKAACGIKWRVRRILNSRCPPTARFAWQKVPSFRRLLGNPREGTDACSCFRPVARSRRSSSDHRRAWRDSNDRSGPSRRAPGPSGPVRETVWMRLENFRMIRMPLAGLHATPIRAGSPAARRAIRNPPPLIPMPLDSRRTPLGRPESKGARRKAALSRFPSKDCGRSGVGGPACSMPRERIGRRRTRRSIVGRILGLPGSPKPASIRRYLLRSRIQALRILKSVIKA